MRCRIPICRACSTLCLCFCLSTLSFAQRADADIRNSIEVSHMTALYLDCAEVAKADDGANLGDIAAHWGESLMHVKQFFSSDDESHVPWAISLEESIDYQATHTHATANQVSDRIKATKLVITRKDGAAQSFIEGPPVIEITTGLIRRVCHSLLPAGDFSKLLDEARVSAQKGDVPEELQVQDHLRTEASKLAASFRVHDITYAGLRIFTLGHELSHATLDKFSTDLTDGSVYAGGQDCAAAFFTETRADLVGQAAVESTSLKDMLGDPFATHLHEFSPEELKNMNKTATVLSSEEQLKVVVSTKEWETDACLSPEQRRQALHDSISRRQTNGQH